MTPRLWLGGVGGGIAKKVDILEIFRRFKILQF